MVLYSSNEPGELWQWQCDDDGTINIVVRYFYYYECTVMVLRRRR